MKRIILAILLFVCLGFMFTPDLSTSGILQVTLGTTQGRSNVLKTGTLASSATTVDQVVVTYTVTAGKNLFLQAIDVQARLTTFASTATNFGNCSLESPAGTKLRTQMLAGPGVSNLDGFQVAEPMVFGSGVVVRLVCTPSAVTPFTWTGNILGYER